MATTTDLVGLDLREWRESVGLTQQELAVRVGVQRTSVTLWESGERNPSGSAGMLLEQLRKTLKPLPEKK